MDRLAAAATAPGRLVRRRPTKLQVAVLGIVTLLSFGPLVALLIVIGGDDGPVAQLIDGPPAPEGGAQMNVTLVDVAPSLGEVRARIVLQLADGLSDEGRPVTDLLLRANDVRGVGTIEFPAGEPLRPVEVTLALTQGSVSRYPFDRYSLLLSLALGTESSGEVTPVPFSYDLFSNVDQFGIAVDADTAPLEPSALSFVELRVSRAMTTTLYSVWMMTLMWGLSIAGVLVVWAATIWDVELPVWSFAYLVGVLFALPQLRESLPGRPPSGTLLDFVAFYWSIAIVGVTLIAVLAIWVQRARPDPRAPESAAPER